MARILVVDDEKNILITLNEFLKEAGHSVFTAEDAFMALETMKNNQIDLILCDIMLPRIKGTDLLFTVRAVYPQVRLILFTGQPSEETKALGEKAGAAAYLAKPVTKEVLLETVRRVLG